MNIFEVMAFDFGEFITSLPGILIIAGIIFIVIAICLLVSDTSKVEKQLAQNTQPVDPNLGGGEPAPSVTASVAPSAPEMTGFSVPASSEPVMNPVTPTVDVAADIPVMTQPDATLAVNPTPEVTVPVAEVTPVVPEAPVVDIPQVDVNQTVSPVVEQSPVQPVVPTMDTVVQPEPVVTPEIPTSVMESAPVVPEAPVVEPVVEPVVAEVTPVIQPAPVVEEPRPIYGGANPLENTAPVPTFKAEAYSGGKIPAEEVASVVETPVVAPVAEPTPVQPEPVVEPVAQPTSVEMPTQVAPVEATPVAEPTPVQPEPVVEPVAQPTSVEMPTQVAEPTPVAEVEKPKDEIESLDF